MCDATLHGCRAAVFRGDGGGRGLPSAALARTHRGVQWRGESNGSSSGRVDQRLHMRYAGFCPRRGTMRMCEENTLDFACEWPERLGRSRDGGVEFLLELLLLTLDTGFLLELLVLLLDAEILFELFLLMLDTGFLLELLLLLCNDEFLFELLVMILDAEFFLELLLLLCNVEFLLELLWLLLDVGTLPRPRLVAESICDCGDAIVPIEIFTRASAI